MKIWFDTEFIEDGRTIELISIGLVREDGAELYLESAECDLSKANAWVREHVLSKLTPKYNATTRAVIRDAIFDFAGDEPEFWAYYADYDWVALCQLFGRMIDLPKGWPMFCRDLVQEAKHLKLMLPEQDPATEHHALNDARWTRDAYLWLRRNEGVR